MTRSFSVRDDVRISRPIVTDVNLTLRERIVEGHLELFAPRRSNSFDPILSRCNFPSEFPAAFDAPHCASTGFEINRLDFLFALPPDPFCADQPLLKALGAAG